MQSQNIPMSVSPERLLQRQQRQAIPDLAREYDAKQALKQHYQAQAERLGMSYAGYCQRFGVRV